MIVTQDPEHFTAPACPSCGALLPWPVPALVIYGRVHWTCWSCNALNSSPVPAFRTTVEALHG